MNNIFFITTCILLFSCNQNKSNKFESSKQNKQKQNLSQPIQQDSVSFKDFLVHFEPDTSFENWVDECQTSLVLNGDIFKESGLDDLLFVLFSKIPSEKHEFLSTKKLQQLAPDVEITNEPLNSFDFHGFKQIKYPEFILTALFAKKKSRDVDNEFYGHAFLLSTYTKSGEHIDDYVWWIVDHDTYQLWTAIEVRGDALLSGEKKNIADDTLSKIHEEVTLNSTGYFLIKK